MPNRNIRFNTSNNMQLGNNRFLRHISEFIGETVTIFTTSGGASGCGFTGVILTVNPCFVRLITEIGSAPSNPLSEEICGDMDDEGPGGPGLTRGRGCGRHNDRPGRVVGSVVDIPVDRIAAFVHNAV